MLNIRIQPWKVRLEKPKLNKEDLTYFIISEAHGMLVNSGDALTVAHLNFALLLLGFEDISP